jgi:hypothetical protein
MKGEMGNPIETGQSGPKGVKRRFEKTREGRQYVATRPNQTKG